MRVTTRELDDLLTTAHLTEGVSQDLAVLAGDDGGDLLLVRVEQFAELEEDLHALGQGGAAPSLGGGLRGSHGRVHVLTGREVDRLGDLAGGGVVDVTVALRGAVPEATVDPMRDAFGRCHCYLSCVVRPLWPPV